MWRDIDIQLRKQQDGDVMEMENDDAIVNSLRNIFQTMQGSRRMRPTFPYPYHHLLFQPVDETTAAELGSGMLEGISNWDDRVSIKGISINANEDEGQYECNMSFTSQESSEEPQSFDYILKQQG